ncbi:TetR/AcrR family transcriptional regulator [Paenibacillus eucommiae]|uniref:AcrR family transcriptional regulator n=1 Tax=Paenibacillus eucommiae TaxID=1355755 RepID=A0ABS4IP81_9BACL|nr:TetR/AcrR family transcriptional regulator [Paenibacillus eucommiae]MBP1989364.1 AcrR family transcriptional regulator [Paenibacillus eucommiae]
MNGFEKRAERIKEKIIQNTFEMLKTWEPKRIRVADIAKKANVSQVTIYNYFGSKEALLREVFKDYLNKTTAEFEAYIDEKHSLKEIVQYSIMRGKGASQTLPYNVLRDLMTEDAELYRYIEEYKGKVMPIMIRLINEGKERGEMSSKISTPTILTFIDMFFRHSQQLLDIAKEHGDIEQFVEELNYLFFYGISGKDE